MPAAMWRVSPALPTGHLHELVEDGGLRGCGTKHLGVYSPLKSDPERERALPACDPETHSWQWCSKDPGLQCPPRFLPGDAGKDPTRAQPQSCRVGDCLCTWGCPAPSKGSKWPSRDKGGWWEQARHQLPRAVACTAHPVKGWHCWVTSWN